MSHSDIYDQGYGEKVIEEIMCLSKYVTFRCRQIIVAYVSREAWEIIYRQNGSIDM